MNVLIYGAVSELGRRVLLAELVPPDFCVEFTHEGDPDRVEKLGRCEVVLVDQAPLDEQAFSHLRRLRLVQRIGRGPYDVSNEVATAHRHGIPWAHNRAGFAVAATAEHTVMVILALLRQLPQTAEFVRSGGWLSSHRFDAATRQLRGSTVALVGMGRVGTSVARLLDTFGAVVHYWSRTRLDGARERRLAVKFLPLDDLLATADVVSLHVRANSAAEFRFDDRLFGLMRSDAIFVNTARGPLVDELALAGALSSGHLAGAALDVFEIEPLPPGSPLVTAPNLLMTPHIAGRTVEVAEMYFRTACANLIRLRGNQPLRDLVAPPIQETV